MYQKIRSISLSLLTLVCFYSLLVPALAHSTANNDLPICGVPRFEKVYVGAENVIVASEGIFFLNEDGVARPAQLVAIDSHGVYVIVKMDELYHCPGCNRWSHGTYCKNEECPWKGL